MVSHWVRLMLLERKALFTREQLAGMTDAEGWRWIESYDRVQKAKRRGAAVCFTGVGDARKRVLARIAEFTGFHVASSVTQSLALLCTGPTAGPSKLAKAKAQGVVIIDEAEFLDAYAIPVALSHLEWFAELAPEIGPDRRQRMRAALSRCEAEIASLDSPSAL